MKKIKLIFTLLSVLFISITMFSQTASNYINCFPKNSVSGRVEITGKIFKEGMTKDVLYTKLFSWSVSKSNINGEAGSGGNGQAISDRETGIIKFPTQILYPYKTGVRSVFLSIQLVIKDGSFEYTISNFSMNKKMMEEYLVTKLGDVFYKSAFEDVCKKVNALVEEMKTVN